ncbi:hypothetical protein [Arthrobacter sp. HY1533]|uniref:hypothetical protein n=1 Tax=Arthrobacter sp. HY1533 TaxID=2970919 RepID=UPI0022B9FEC0|nr:hypothetical protein [Arthrobacter sp. HY1533]
MVAVKPAKAKRYGCETPRIFTPPLRELTPETSLGFEVIEFAALLGVTLLPWQKWLLIHALELNLDGTYRFRTVLLLVARQNGKSLVMQVLTLWRMVVDAARLVIGTAQNLDVSEEQWAEAVELLRDSEFGPLVAKVETGSGRKMMKLVTRERYKVAAASRKGGRGKSAELVLMDELREHTNWEAWAAVTFTTMARANAQIWAASNAGDPASIVLRYLRNQAHAALGNPDNIQDLGEITVPEEWLDEEYDDEEFSDALGIFEWSALPECSVWDRNGWQQANPSLGYGYVTERAIAAAARTPDRVFRTEVLCQWLDTVLAGIFPDGAWELAKDPASRRASPDYMFCIDVQPGNTGWAHIAVAALQKDGLLHVELAESRGGTAWIVPWFKRLVNKDGMKEGMLGVTLQANGAPVSALLTDLEAIEGLNVIPWGGSDLSRGMGMFWNLVRGVTEDEAGQDIELADREPLFRHRGDPLLTLAAQMAVTKPAGDGAWLVDRMKSPVDVAPLIAVMGAAWAYVAKKPEPVKRSKYEDGDLLTY